MIYPYGVCLVYKSPIEVLSGILEKRNFKQLKALSTFIFDSFVWDPQTLMVWFYFEGKEFLVAWNLSLWISQTFCLYCVRLFLVIYFSVYLLPQGSNIHPQFASNWTLIPFVLWFLSWIGETVPFCALIISHEYQESS